MKKYALVLKLLLFLFIIFTSAITTTINAQSFLMTRLGQNKIVDNPNTLLIGPDGYLWVSERVKGNIIRIHPEDANKDIVATIASFTSTRQDGLLGFAFHPDFNTTDPYVYVSYTYMEDNIRKQRIARYTYSLSGNDGTLSDPVTLIENLPASNDHNSGKLIIGMDRKIYYTLGDQGNNQNTNYCNPILSLVLPSQDEINAEDWTHYQGKILRINLDGSIPDDNPTLAAVKSHVYTYGHRNAQGLAVSNGGLIYSSEHGPNTDDELNIITAGMDYGWPRVVGYKDSQGYRYCSWADLADCEAATYANNQCPGSVTVYEEDSYQASNYKDPLYSLFAVDDDYNYNDPRCQDAWVCRPNIAPAGIGIYESDAIPTWTNSILIASLKRGKIYKLNLSEDGQSVVGDTTTLFYTQNRYRDIAISQDGKKIYLLTDETGVVTDITGYKRANGLANPSSILIFTLDESVNTDDLEAADMLTVAPNPTSQRLSFNFNHFTNSQCTATLLDANGKALLKSDVKGGINNIDVSYLPTSMYTLIVEWENKRVYKKVAVY